MKDSLERLLGAPVAFEELESRRGRTLRASGSRGRARVRIYASGSAPELASRIALLAGGPAEPCIPRVLAVDRSRNALVLAEVPGRPFREALLDGDRDACARVGRALALWHGAWRGRTPSGALGAHTAERELRGLRALLGRASPLMRSLGAATLADLAGAAWPPDTVVHRKLDAEQVLLGERVGLAGVDDAAIGPAELDVASLCAHMQLLGHRNGLDLGPLESALVQAYEASGGSLDAELLAQCRAVSLLRLGCIHRTDELLSRPAIAAGAA